jgi:hypothetical protein
MVLSKQDGTVVCVSKTNFIIFHTQRGGGHQKVDTNVQLNYDDNQPNNNM